MRLHLYSRALGFNVFASDEVRGPSWDSSESFPLHMFAVVVEVAEYQDLGSSRVTLIAKDMRIACEEPHELAASYFKTVIFLVRHDL